MSKTMLEKIWDAHVVSVAPGETTILYIDRHLIHEVTSPQAFSGLRLAGRSVHRPDATISVLDHNIPRVPGRRKLDVVDNQCVESILTMEKHANEHGIILFQLADG